MAIFATARSSFSQIFWGSEFHCLFFLVIFLSASSAVSTSSTIVKTLPGFPGPLPFKLETGYVSVQDSELFYYFVESQGNPQKDPLLLYIVGGPYCSALNGFFYQTGTRATSSLSQFLRYVDTFIFSRNLKFSQTGPLKFNTTNYSEGFPTLCLKEQTWTKLANIIYIEQPAGTGYSYSKGVDGPKSSDTGSARNTHEFMRKWLDSHPAFINNDFFVLGDSYGGFVAPIVVQEIVNGNRIGLEPRLNLVGYILSAPHTDKVLHGNLRISQAYYLGLASKSLYESARRNCKGEYVNVDPSNVDCLKDVNAMFECWRDVNYWRVIDSRCQVQDPMPNNVQGPKFLRLFSSNSTKPICTCEKDVFTYQSELWANDHTVRSALNVKKGTRRLYRCDHVLAKEYYNYDVESVIDYHRNFTETNLRVLVYSADLDMSVPHISTQAWISSLNLDVIDDWRPWFVNNQVAGYTMKYARSRYSLTYATIKGSGHTPSEYKPTEAYNMFNRWLNHEPI